MRNETTKDVGARRASDAAVRMWGDKKTKKKRNTDRDEEGMIERPGSMLRTTTDLARHVGGVANTETGHPSVAARRDTSRATRGLTKESPAKTKILLAASRRIAETIAGSVRRMRLRVP